MTSIEVLQRAEAIVGEGPAWDARSQTLHWVDILAGTAHATTLEGVTRSFSVDGHLAGVLPTEDPDQLLLLMRDGFRLRKSDGTLRDLALPLADLPGIRFNDGKVDPRGRAFGDTMAYEWQGGDPIGALYRLDAAPDALTAANPAASVTTIESPTRLSNGIGWSPDGRLMYFTDSGAQTTYVYDYDLDTGTTRNRRVFLEVPKQDGLPDGLAVDDAGCVWIALHGSGTIRRYSPDARTDRTIDIPATQVTSLCFIGPRLDTIAVTSARYLLADGALGTQPLAGSVFTFDANTTGPAATPWAPR
ncbi:SMP-30/gluconolactonase/LRE family protein [Microbacterium sp. H1-D42]|uniref:SMP-30/gluconolactonase/LRE family protein n=1 Tax=Microbacterium sp. H1-D42 TaxID=2925844 RepID=UPI001F53AD46|nr:SMP-30/gluconolactonase/LRE family protein [Microbacterium sp. H1-D42]UNK70470.1 SMP-30/gluconolactonase/LRE family protein [Microbacterium sp. H1-D42]